MNLSRPALLLTLAAAPLAAQEHPETARRIAELEKKLETLSRELEGQKTGSTAAPEAKEGQHGLAPAASKVYGAKGGLSIGGYGEALYQNFSAKLENGSYAPKHNTADLYRQIIYTGYKFNDWIVLNSEIEFEHGYAAGAQTVTTTTINGQKVVTDVKAKRPGDVEVEFAYLDFLFHPAFNVRAGMMLIPMGFINEMHEPPTYLGTMRPAVERNLLPTTWRENGVGIHGDLKHGFSYRAYLVNGLAGSRFTKDGIKDGRQHGASALAEAWALTGRLDWVPAPGVLLGASFFNGNSQQEDNLPKLATRIFDVHAEYRWRGLQVRGLFTGISIDKDGLPASGAMREVGTSQRGHYLEAGYDVLGHTGSSHALIPFVRVEKLQRQASVAEGVTPDRSLDERIVTAGLVYKPIPQVAIKADLNRISNAASTGRNQFNVAFGYYF